MRVRLASARDEVPGQRDGAGAELVPERGWLTIGQAARRLGVSESTVRRLIDERILPAVRYLGTRILKVRREDLEAYVAASRVPRG